MGILTNIDKIINGEQRVDNAFLQDAVNGNVRPIVKRIKINTADSTQMGVGSTNPYTIGFPFKKISFPIISDGFGLATQNYSSFMSLVLGKKGEQLTDADVLILRYGDSIELDEIQTDAYFWFPAGLVFCNVYFSVGMKFELGNNISTKVIPNKLTNVTAKSVALVAVLLSASSQSIKKAIHVFNNGANTIYVGSLVTLTGANAYPILANTGQRFEINGDLYAIALAGVNDVRVSEEYI